MKKMQTWFLISNNHLFHQEANTFIKAGVSMICKETAGKFHRSPWKLAKGLGKVNKGHSQLSLGRL